MLIFTLIALIYLIYGLKHWHRLKTGRHKYYQVVSYTQHQYRNKKKRR
jgi:hypothetical protein